MDHNVIYFITNIIHVNTMLYAIKERNLAYYAHFFLGIAVLNSTQEPSTRVTNVVLVGGSKYFDLNTDFNTLVVGMSARCLQDLGLSLVGPKFFCECPELERKVDIAYMGTQTVEVEVVKKVVLVDVRGDTLPEHERDLIVIHFGGLPEQMVKESKHRQYVRGVTGSLPLNGPPRVFEIGGRRRNKYKQEKQIIHVGINHVCNGKLQLRDVGDKKLVQCKENLEELEALDQSIGGRHNTEVITIPKKVPKKARKKTLLFRNETIPISGMGRKIGNGQTKNHVNKTGIAISGIDGNRSMNEIVQISDKEMNKSYDGYLDVSSGTRFENNHENLASMPSGFRLNKIQNQSAAELEDNINNAFTKIPRKDPSRADVGDEFEGLNHELLEISVERNEEMNVGIEKKEKELKFEHQINLDTDIGKDLDEEVIEITGQKKKRVNKPVNKRLDSMNNIRTEMTDKRPVTVAPDDSLGESVRTVYAQTHKEKSLTHKIEGRIFEIHEANYVKARDRGKYVEIGSGKACTSQMEVKLVGSTLYSRCDRRNVTMEYIGSGPTDIEVTHTLFMVDGDKWNTYQNEDFILLYVGGIPDKLRHKNTKSVIIKGVSPRGTSVEEERVIEIVGQGVPMRRYQRQIVVMGISRQCEDYLFTTSVSGKTVVECAVVEHENVRLVGQEKNTKASEEIVIKGQSNSQPESGEIVVTGISPAAPTHLSTVNGNVPFYRYTQRPTIPRYRNTVPPVYTVDSLNTGRESSKEISISGNRKQTTESREIIIEGIAPALTTKSHGVDSDLRPHERGNYKTIDMDVTVEKEANIQGGDENGTVERLFLISGMEKTNIVSDQNIHLGFKNSGCRHTDFFEIVAVESSLEVGCGVGQKPVHINYIGSQPTDIYLSRSVHIFGKGPSKIDHGVSVFIGGHVARKLEQREVVEIIKNVSGGRTTGTRRVVSFGGINTDHGESMAVVDIGFSRECHGRLQKQVEMGKTLISCIYNKKKPVVLTGASAVEEKHEENVIVSGHLPNTDRTSEHTFLISGQSSMNKDKSSVRRTIIVDTKTEKPETTTTATMTTTATTTTTTTEKPTTQPPLTTQKQIRVDKIYLAGQQEQIVKHEITTEKPFGNVLKVIENLKIDRVEVLGTWKTRPILNEDGQKKENVKKIILVGRAQFVTVNKTEQSINIGFIENCLGNYNVVGGEKSVRVGCVDKRSEVPELEIYTLDSSDIEVSTSVKLEKHDIDNRHDKVHIQLGGIQQRVDTNVTLLTTNSTRGNLTRNGVVFVDGLVESTDDMHIKVVEIGIKEICRGGEIDKYVDEEGTIVYCQRRADILPEESGYYDYDQNFGFSSEVSQEPGQNLENINNMTESSHHSGVFVEGKNDNKKFQVRVTSEQTHKDQAILAPIINTSRPIPESEIFDGTKLYHIEGAYALENSVNSSRSDSDIRRGDIVFAEEYQRDTINDLKINVRGNQTSNSHHNFGRPGSNIPDIRGGQHRQFNIELNQSLEIDVGDNCKGKFEAMETEAGVVVKCTVGNETFQLSLAGYGKIGDQQTNRQSDANIQNDLPAKLKIIYRDADTFITERTVTDRQGGIIQTVYFASPLRTIRHSDETFANTDDNTYIPVDYGDYQLDDPHGGFIDFPILTSVRRGDLDDTGMFPEKRRRKRSVFTVEMDAIQGSSVFF